MNNQFDELIKSTSQPVTRRQVARFELNEARGITNGTLEGNGYPILHHLPHCGS